MEQKPSANLNSRTAILVITILASFLIPFMTSSISIALPAIGDEFNLNVIALSWVTSAYILGSAALLVPFGRLADMYGRRKVFLAGNIVFTIGAFLSVVVKTGGLLLLSRVIQGIGGAAIFATAIAILTSAYPAKDRGRVLGINTAAVYIGLSMGPVLGGFMTRYLGWRSIFIGCTAVSALVVLAILWKLRAEFETKKEKFDVPGALLYSLVLITLMYGFSELPQMAGVWLLIGAVAGGGLFLWWENRTPTPLIHLNLFRQNRGFAFSNLAALVNYSGTWAVSFVLSLYLQEIKGFSSETAGFILVSSPAIQAVFSPIFGKLSDRVEPRALASAGMAVTTIGIAMLIFLTQNTPVVYIVGALVLLGFGFALFSSPNTNAIMSSADQKVYGFASATLATMRQIGMMLSMGVVMVVFAMVIGKVKITQENHPAFITSTHVIFLIAAISCFAAIFASLARGNIHHARKQSEK
ncbi:MAG: MFS transporter [Dehalococcoidales bacterium]|nr:MFS transporter [Dehalococcoidales bacterium]